MAARPRRAPGMIATLLAGLLAADTVRVPPGEPDALRQAIRAAPPGSVVIVGPGTYTGPLLLDRPLTIVGRGRPIVDGGGRGSVVRVTARGVHVTGLDLRHSGADIDRDDAGVAVDADSVLLADLRLSDVLHGVYLRHVAHVRLQRLTIRGRPGVHANRRGDGIHFYYSTDVLAEGNDIADVRDGMYFSYSDTTVVRGNRVRRSRYGLHYMFSHANIFEHNAFTESAAGSSIMNSRDVIARDNVFAWNRGAGSFGLLQQTTERTVLERNAFIGNGAGLFLDGATDGVVQGNLVLDNFVGLQLFGSSTGNRITGNIVAGNTYAATGSAGDSRLCVDGRGNYWSGADGWDLDRDGVQDVAYQAASPLSELSRERPALRLFLASPAATVLAWAERALPVFAIDGVLDPCPLHQPPALAAVPPASAIVPAAGGGWMSLVAGLSTACGVLTLLASRHPARA